MKALLLIAMCFITGCSTQGIYDALRYNECLEKEGIIHCDDGRDYKKYRHEREELLKDNKNNGDKNTEKNEGLNLPNL